MKLHYQKFYGLVGIFFSVWLVLTAAKLIGFNLGINPSLVFSVFAVNGAIFLILETIKNKKEIIKYISRQIKLQEVNFILKKGEIQQKIVQKSPISFEKHHLGKRIFSLFGYFLTSMIYLSDFFVKSKVFSYVIICLLAAMVIFDIFISEVSVKLVFMLFLVAWFFSTRHFTFRVNLSLAAALSFLAFCPLLIVIKNVNLADKMAVWSYNFFLVGIVQLVLDYLRKEK